MSPVMFKAAAGTNFWAGSNLNETYFTLTEINMQYIIIGATVSGIHAAKTLREHAPDAKIYVVSFEINPLGYYDREHMPAHLVRGASNPSDGLIEDARALAGQGIELDYDLMEAVFPKRDQILLNHGIRKSYDKLLLAMESTPMIHEAPGANWIGVHQLRIYEDITWIENWMNAIHEKGAVIISHGIHNMDNDGKLGLEMADVLRQRDAGVTYVTSAERIGAPFLDIAISEKIAERLAVRGVDVYTGASVAAYISDDEAVVDAVELADGRRIETRMALSTVGVQPTIDVIEDHDVDTDDETDAIIVNEHLQTNWPNIFAAGSVASLKGYIAHNSAQAAEQGRIAALNMLGQDVTYKPFMGDLNARLFDQPFAYLGTMTGERWTLEETDHVAVVYMDGGQIQGAQMLNMPEAFVERVASLYESSEATTLEALDGRLQTT